MDKVNVIIQQADERRLLRAAFRGEFKAVETILKNNNINIINCRCSWDCGWTPLHYASQCKNEDVSGQYYLDIIQLLLHNKADVNSTDKQGQTPLHLACIHGNIEIINVLIQNGANVNAVDRNGETPLHKVCHCTNRLHVILILLLNHRANIDSQDHSGRTPLRISCQNFLRGNNNLSVIHLLLQNGANVNIPDIGGFTPLHVACSKIRNSNNYYDMVQLLLTAGANMNLVNFNKEKPIDVAYSTGNFDIVELLQSKQKILRNEAYEWLQSNQNWLK